MGEGQAAEVVIRPAGVEDAAAIAELVAELARSLGEHSAVSAGAVRQHLATPGNGVLVAVVGGAVAGMLSYSIRPSLYHGAAACLVEELAVAAAQRRRGIGSALLEALVELARAAGCAEVSLSVLPSNRAAVRLYRRLGFVDEALLLERHLPGV